jgi:hypothetical protein
MASCVVGSRGRAAPSALERDEGDMWGFFACASLFCGDGGKEYHGGKDEAVGHMRTAVTDAIILGLIDESPGAYGKNLCKQKGVRWTHALQVPNSAADAIRRLKDLHDQCGERRPLLARGTAGAREKREEGTELGWATLFAEKSPYDSLFPKAL